MTSRPSWTRPLYCGYISVHIANLDITIPSTATDRQGCKKCTQVHLFWSYLATVSDRPPRNVLETYPSTHASVKVTSPPLLSSELKLELSQIANFPRMEGAERTTINDVNDAQEQHQHRQRNTSEEKTEPEQPDPRAEKHNDGRRHSYLIIRY